MNKTAIFLPGTKSSGGLSRHGICLSKEYQGAFCWDFEEYPVINKKLFAKFPDKILGKLVDQNFLKFETIDLCATSFFNSYLNDFSTILAFSGCALRLFQAAKSKRTKFLELESPTAHVMHCHEAYIKAAMRHPIEKSWLTRKLRDKMLAEYHIADRIWVNSEYAKQTFLERGIQESKLARRLIHIDKRFLESKRLVNDKGFFRIIYVGSLTVTKGVPILVEAFSKLKMPNLRLRLVGGTGSRGMWNYLQRYRLKDPRIEFGPGDPLPELRQSDLFVFPSWSDGYGLAAAEAIAVGLPVIVSQNTGMKELVSGRGDCLVVPPGNVDALVQAIQKYLNSTT